MLLHPWLSRWSARLRAPRNQLHRTRRRIFTPIAAQVRSLEPRVLLSALPAGSEFRVNTVTTGGQTRPKIATDADGDYVVVWQSDGQDGSSYGVFAQRYNAAGVAQGSEFRVNTQTLNTQKHPVVAMDADGDFVVAWVGGGQDGSFDGVFAQRYDASGVAQGSEFRVNTYTTDTQIDATVAMDAEGDFVIAWTSSGQDGSGSGIFAQRYDFTGAAQGSEFQVNLYTASEQSRPSVAMDADGDFVIAWQSYLDGSLYGIYAQRYNAAGVEQGREFRVNTYTSNRQSDTAVAMDADGDFVITWSSLTQDGDGFGTFAQRYNAAGVVQGGEFQVNIITTLDQFVSAIAMDADGDFVIAWSSYGQDGSGSGIYAQRYNAAGVEQGREFLVNTYTTGTQARSAVAMDAEGDFVIFWVSVDQDGSSNGVYAQRFRMNRLPVITPQTFAIAENRPVGYVVGTVVASDPDPGQTLTYAIAAGNPNGQFAIHPTTGVITVAKATINFEAINQYQLTVRVTENGTPNPTSSSATITINVTNINEAPTFLAPTTFTIAENRSVGYIVGDVNAVDPENNTLTYSIVGGNPNAQFTINPTTGVITVAKATINFEATPQFLLSVKAQDNGSPANSKTQTVTVNVTNINEAPVFLAPTTFTIAENSVNGTVVGTAQTVDPENNTRTYSITAGNTNNGFAINATTGQITVNNQAALDFETTPQFLLSVKALDNGSPANSKTQTITINLTDIVGARVPATKPATGSDLATSAGSTGQQVVVTAAAAISPPKRTPPASEPVLYSFTLFEPLAAAPTGDEEP